MYVYGISIGVLKDGPAVSLRPTVYTYIYRIILLGLEPPASHVVISQPVWTIKLKRGGDFGERYWIKSGEKG